MADKKVNAMLYTPPPVEITGYKPIARRRLGIEFELKLVELVLNAGVKLGIDPNQINEMTVGEIAGHLYSLMAVALDDVLAFLHGLLIDPPFTVDEMKDPDKFPLGSLEAIIESIVADKDVEAFFGRIRRLIALAAKLRKKTPSPNKSLPSKKRRGGQTKK